MSSGRPLFVNLAWEIVVGVLVIHAVTTAAPVMRACSIAQTFAQSTIDRALVFRDVEARPGSWLRRWRAMSFAPALPVTRVRLPNGPGPTMMNSCCHRVLAVISSMLAERNVVDRDRFVYGFAIDGVVRSRT